MSSKCTPQRKNGAIWGFHGCALYLSPFLRMSPLVNALRMGYIKVHVLAEW